MYVYMYVWLYMHTQYVVDKISYLYKYIQKRTISDTWTFPEDDICLRGSGIFFVSQIGSSWVNQKETCHLTAPGTESGNLGR